MIYKYTQTTKETWTYSLELTKEVLNKVYSVIKSRILSCSADLPTELTEELAEELLSGIYTHEINLICLRDKTFYNSALSTELVIELRKQLLATTPTINSETIENKISLE